MQECRMLLIAMLNVSENSYSALNKWRYYFLFKIIFKIRRTRFPLHGIVQKFTLINDTDMIYVDIGD